MHVIAILHISTKVVQWYCACSIRRTSLEHVDSWIWIWRSSAVQKVRSDRSTQAGIHILYIQHTALRQWTAVCFSCYSPFSVVLCPPC